MADEPEALPFRLVREIYRLTREGWSLRNVMVDVTVNLASLLDMDEGMEGRRKSTWSLTGMD
jgi:hypothetical protein